MTVPNAPTEGDGAKIHFLVGDSAGTNVAALWRGRRTATVNGELQGAADVYPVSGLLGHGYRALTASTQLQLSTTSVPCQGVLLKAAVENAAAIYVGVTGLTADKTAATGGFPLEPGEKQSFPCTNMNELYLRGTSGDGVHWVANKDS